MPEDELSAGESTEVSKKYLGKFELSFYSKEQFPNSPTSTGVMPEVGRTVAVDPKVIPYGTSIEIDGFGVRVAEDTGGAIKGKKLDIFVETTAEAFQLGRIHNVDVWVVE
jgi:3D (Asp-Asp-Asp) domain-containing protein